MLRDIISKFFGISRNRGYSWIFYNQYDKSLLIDMLNRFGLREENVTKHFRRAKNDTKKYKDPSVKLVSLLSRNIYNAKSEYGINTPVNSEYYINTMDASHIGYELNLMCDLIAILIDKKGGCTKPDFIITPKNGNPVLGKSYAQSKNTISILSKHEKDKSYADFNKNENPLATLMINFEGFSELYKIANDKPDINLNGIVIDCNASGGSLILETINSFNKLLNELKKTKKDLNIESLEYSYVLYRPDNEENIDDKFKDDNCFCERYFDLTENYKKRIYDNKNNYYNEFRRGNNLNKIIKDLREDDLYKFE
jgi:hypothetical protein